MFKRIKLLIVFLSIGFLAVIGKLFYWQIICSSKLQALAENQHSVSLEIPAPRGKIYSSDKFPLVLNQKTYNLFLVPQKLKISPDELFKKLQGIFQNTPYEEQINEKKEVLSGEKLYWMYLVKNLEEEQKEKIEALKIEGIGFEEQEKRLYPENSLLSHTLGFVGGSKDGVKGYYGLEGFYENELKGRPGLRIYEKDAIGEPLPLGKDEMEPPIPGRDLVLNIIRPLQFLVEKHLQNGIEKYQASSGWVVIMDVRNGHLLASASFPSYHPFYYYQYDQEFFTDPVVSSSFEPGSIFKVIVMASALDSGAINQNDICTQCSGPKKIGEYTIRTWNDKYYPNSTMTDILVHSDNVGMVFVANKTGSKKLYQYLKKFGFGEKTGIDLMGEISPVLKSPESWSEIDQATISFGQGIAVTPIQILTAISSIANGGTLFQPQVVNKIVEKGKEVNLLPKEKGKTISSQTAVIVRDMMIEAVERGEAKWAKPKNYTVAGKTGTAQIPIAGHYDPEKTIASFIGFAPAKNPVFAMLVSLKEPKTSPWGSETAAPLWFEIANDALKLLNIPPDKNY